jgi:hypothetical protein
LSQSELSIWTIDVDAMQGSGSSSNLMTRLALESGGQYRRRATGIIPEAIEQERCYYSFSLPIYSAGDKHVDHRLAIMLDHETYPELWPLKVIAPDQAVVWDRKELDTGRRIAALLNPDDFGKPPVHVQVGFPIEKDGKLSITTRVRVGLTDLTWLPTTDQRYETRLSLDAVLDREDEFGTDTICSWGADSAGAISLRLPSPPAVGTEGGLVIELQCAVKNAKYGMYVARAVINDLSADLSGAGLSSSYFERKVTDDRWRMIAGKLIVSSGLEFLWTPGSKAAKRDRTRAVGRELREGETVRPDETLHLEYLLCGPSRGQAEQRVSAGLVRVGSMGERVIQQWFPASSIPLESSAAPDKRFCAPARLTIPENTLESGKYELVVSSEGRTEDALAIGGVLGRIPIEVTERR